MKNIRAVAIDREKIKTVAVFAGLLALATFVPFFIHNQFITGPIVNAILLIAVVTVSLPGAIMIGLIPSLVALASGLLPAALAPAVPFIMISNALLAISFHYLRQYNFGVGVVAAAVIKYAFLFFTASLVINLLLKSELADKVTVMMSWPQLLTALLGGIIAYGALKVWKKSN